MVYFLRSTAMNVFGFTEVIAKRFTPHSLRYGGASTKAVVGIPKYQVQLAGRWKSEAFSAYVKTSFEFFSQTQEVLLYHIHRLYRLQLLRGYPQV